MNAKELKQRIENNEPISIIDIREPFECENGHICDYNIPLDEVLSRIDEVPRDITVIIYCNSGKRSQSLKYMIEKLHNYDNIHHLEGGYSAWEQI